MNIEWEEDVSLGTCQLKDSHEPVMKKINKYIYTNNHSMVKVTQYSFMVFTSKFHPIESHDVRNDDRCSGN